MAEEHLTKAQRRELKRQEKLACRQAAQRKKMLKIYASWGIFFLIISIGVYFLFQRQDRASSLPPSSIMEVRSDDWIRGEKSSPVTLIEYSDFQCPACAAYYPLVKQLEQEFSGKMKMVYRHFPLMSIHQNALSAALAAESAGRQGKFWQMHDLLFENQSEWSQSRNVQDVFLQYARNLDLDEEKFLQDFQEKQLREKVLNQRGEGIAIGVNATPTFFLNGKKIANPKSFEEFQEIITSALEQIDRDTVSEGDTSKERGDEVHIHADFLVFIHGSPLDFSIEKYQAEERDDHNSGVHLHNSEGGVIHIHKRGTTLGDFFQSLDMMLSKECLILETKEQYCNDKNNTLKLYVNGERNEMFDAYEIRDLDRIVLTYGDESEEEIQGQLERVSDIACIYSEKCPARGSPPKELCVGGLGSNCDEE